MKNKIIAFIPVRGGSKSIPLKNIKNFCGKPLVYWNIAALQNCSEIDEIIVATDSEEIKKTVCEFQFDKVKIYNRSVENATDTASTESVMLEYINQGHLSSEDSFMLVQATSPLTQSIHFSEAIQLFNTSMFDSVLSCVKNYRFFWSNDGTPINYDYRQRPRRQDFDGLYMENGAFYINTVDNILRGKNRLSGRIGIYEMPEYTAFEIDEPDDWFILENLMYRHVLSKKKKMSVKLFLSDVDGVMTDGGMYYSEDGGELKKFNTKDGMAFRILREKGIKTGIITSEETNIVKRRAEKLKVDYCIQGKYKSGKLDAVITICSKLGISLSEVAYVGDDINCLELLSHVGYAFCPSNAVNKIKQIPNICIVNCNGGDGVVREILDNYFVF